MEINSISLRKIFDSRGREAVEAEVNGCKGRASSKHLKIPEHLDLAEKKLKQLEGEDLMQEELDDQLGEIDGTGDFSSLGCVATAVSVAYKNSTGYSYSDNFPIPISTIVGKGIGQSGSISQFLVLPVDAESFPEAIETNLEIYKEFKDRYSRRVQGSNIQGSLITSMDDEETLRKLEKVAESYNARIGLNISAEGFYNGEKYKFGSMREMSDKKYFKFVQKLIDNFELVYIEDPFHSEDFRNHAKLTRKNPEVIVSGADLICSEVEKLEESVDNGACNTVTISLDEAITVSNMLEIVKKSRDKDYKLVFKSRKLFSTALDSKICLENGISFIKLNSLSGGTAGMNKLLELWDRIENPSLNE